MTPAERRDELVALARMATNILFGHRAWAHRLSEMVAGYPQGGEGGSGDSGVEYDPELEKTYRDKPGRRDPKRYGEDADDPAKRMADDFDRKLRAAMKALAELGDFQAKGSTPVAGVKAIVDPGCQSCERVFNPQTNGPWWSPSGSWLDVEVTEKLGKRKVTHKTRWRLCGWCYSKTVPSGWGRLPTVAEVTDHLEGRRVKVRAG